MRRIVLAMLVFIWVVWPVMSADPLEVRSKGIQFNYEDSINGLGSFSSYNNIFAQGPHADARIHTRLANVSLQKRNHGSGSIEREMIISSTESITIQIDPDMTYAYALIAALSNSSMDYKPQTASIGNGYYATHPVNFNSLLGDKTQIKNYASETSMVQETKYANAINMDLAASVEDDHFGTGGSLSDGGLARSLMSIEGSITNGATHMGMLQGNISAANSGKSAWHKPDINVDEDYIGTFSFATEMNLTVPVARNVSGDSWLPCCYGGWEDMISSDKKGFGASTKEVFDCACPKVPTLQRRISEI